MTNDIYHRLFTQNPHLWLAVDLNAEEAITQGVYYDEYIAKVCRDDASSVAPCVVRPDDLYLVVSQMA